MKNPLNRRKSRCGPGITRTIETTRCGEGDEGYYERENHYCRRETVGGGCDKRGTPMCALRSSTRSGFCPDSGQTDKYTLPRTRRNSIREGSQTNRSRRRTSALLHRTVFAQRD